MAAHYDVLIVGGGIAGLSLASALAGSCSVALVEAEQELAYHSSSRSARQLHLHRPRRGPGTDGPDPGTDGGPGRATANAGPVAAELYAHRHGGSRPRGGQRHMQPHLPMPRPWSCALPWCRNPSPPPAWTPGPSAAMPRCCWPTTGRVRKPPARTSSPVPGYIPPSGWAPGWEIGAGQEAFQAGVLVNAAGAWADELAVISGVEKLGLQPYRRTAAIVDVEHPLPEDSPMVAAADNSFYFRREGTGVLISPSETVPSGPGGCAAAARRYRAPDREAEPGDHAWDPRRPERVDGAPDRGGRRRPGGRVRRRSRPGSTGSPDRAVTGSRPRRRWRNWQPPRSSQGTVQRRAATPAVRNPGQRRRWPPRAGPSGAEEWSHEYPDNQHRRADDPGPGAPGPEKRRRGDRG